MKHPGKIVITDNKVKFEYYKLKEPRIENYSARDNYISYQRAMEKHEASKRVIEVGNIKKVTGQNIHMYVRTKFLFNGIIVKNNQSCEAEVENNVATIIKIL